MKQDDQDDAPTYVLEDTNQSMTKEEYEEFVGKKESKEDGKPEPEDVAKATSKDDAVKPKDKIAEVGANAKKRKAAKIIIDEHEDGEGETKDAKEVDKKIAKKPKKKTKAVKLTFGDDEED